MKSKNFLILLGIFLLFCFCVLVGIPTKFCNFNFGGFAIICFLGGMACLALRLGEWIYFDE